MKDTDGTMLTWFQVIVRVRNIAEHAVVPDNNDPFRNARTTIANPLARALLAPYWVNYHVEHHLLFWVPCYRLPQVHAALGRFDHVFPSHREHGLAMLMGLPIERLLGIFTGQESGDWDAEQVRFHHLNMVIGGHTLHGVGYAMGQARDRQADPQADDGVSLIIHGDGAISEGDVNEAYIFAAAYQAPAVFLCVNNQWAISEPVERQSPVPLYQRAWGFGIPSVRVDGNDVLAVHAATTWALERARAGQGPSFIEAYTYRMGAHTTSDDPTKSRD